jgi:hypothetical protein
MDIHETKVPKHRVNVSSADIIICVHAYQKQIAFFFPVFQDHLKVFDEGSSRISVIVNRF